MFAPDVAAHSPEAATSVHYGLVVHVAVLQLETLRAIWVRVCVYYCSTYYKAVRVWGGG